MSKVPKSVKGAIKQAKLWAKKEMGGVKDADAEVVESNRILAKMGVKFQFRLTVDDPLQGWKRVCCHRCLAVLGEALGFRPRHRLSP